MNLNICSAYAPLLVRVSISLVFLWFGINQLLLPEDFMGYLPEQILGLDFAQSIVLMNGIFEIILGGLLLVGLFIRPTALLLCIHLLTIIVSLGYNDIAVRDAGLMLITFSIFLGGADKWSLDYKRNRA